MNKYLIDILEKTKSNQFNDSTFIPDAHNWELVKLWYYKYSQNNAIPDKKLLDLLYFFYVHENLDFYDNARFAQVAETMYITYGVETGSLLRMFSDFRKLIYEL